MDKKKEAEAKKRLEEMKKKARETEKGHEGSDQKSTEIPRDAFRKNMGCGG
ncbi:hypothetical protein [Marinoscillum sp.]|uniref:hypothetical protein n=1 Tax=Marinoscillum sp. TaxID=2024838 RepID=UPI003BAB3E79